MTRSHITSHLDPSVYYSEKINTITEAPGRLKHKLTSAVNEYATEIERLRSTALLIADDHLSKSFTDMLSQIDVIKKFLSSAQNVESKFIQLLPIARDIYHSAEHEVAELEATKKSEHNYQIRRFISYHNSGLDAARILDDKDLVIHAINDYLFFLNEEWDKTPDVRVAMYHETESHQNCLNTINQLVSEFEELITDLGFPIISSSAFESAESPKLNDEDLKRFTTEFPEWYMTQILQWIRDNDYLLTVMDRDFLNSDEISFNVGSIRAQFMRGLVVLLLDKLYSDLESVHTPPQRYAIKFELGIEKLDLPKSNTKPSGPNGICGELVNNLEHFGHLVDVILQTDARLTQLAYAPTEPRPSDVLALSTVFGLWIRLEHQLAMSRLDAVLSSPNAWVVLDEDHLQPQLVDDFIALFHAVGVRGRLLTDKLARVRFLRVRLHLCELFFNRLIDYAHGVDEFSGTDRDDPNVTRGDAQITTGISHRLTNALGSIWRSSAQVHKLPGHMLFGSRESQCQSVRWISVLNGLSYLRDTLLELANDRYYVEFWEEQPIRHLLELTDPYLADLGLDDKPVVIMDNLLNLYESGIQRMLKDTVESLLRDVQTSGANYMTTSDYWLRSGWTSRHTGGVLVDAIGVIELSADAASMMIRLKDELFRLHKTLQHNLFTEAWQRIAHEMDTFLYNHLILVNKFSPAGATQLRFDINQCLFPLFVLYTNRPETYFPQCRDALILLNLLRGTAELLRSNLEQHLSGANSDTTTNPLAPLMELGVFCLSVEEAHVILGLRAVPD